MNLVIVESPAKGKTIEKFLGSGYKVLPSFGHLKDLPRKEFGVEIEHNFKPKFVIPHKSKKTASFLKKEAEDAEKIYLATDYDREGEAIAYQIYEMLLNHKSKILNQKFHRITFTEITKEAIKEAIKNPREIDLKLVSAQHARRVLDRIVGYKLSPFLWKKVASGLSAGRVQSPALWLIVKREKEIQNFKSEEYWNIKARLKIKEKKAKIREFEAVLFEKDGKPISKLSIKTESDAKKLLDALKGAQYQVKEVAKSEKKIFPSSPFITSTLQQEAFKRFGFSAKKTMFLAQKLYEGGLITYHRTDSTNLSKFAVNAIRKYIKENFPKEYLPLTLRIYKTKVLRAQEAHEAIRPTYIKSNTKDKRAKIDGEERLYDLIFRRAVASQMTEAVLDTQEVKIRAGDCTFKTSGQTIKFDGFMKIYPLKINEISLPSLTVSEILELIKLLKEQHFTEAKSRYTEATLIRELEKQGIGRPSTYAVILDVIKTRGYVEKIKQHLFPKDIGIVVSDLLKKHFKDVVDLKFTAKMEEELDAIAEGDKKYEEVCQNFWEPFFKNLAVKEKELKKSEIAEQKTDEICEKCGKKMVIKLGRFGKFLSCSDFPKCKYARPYIVSLGQCPSCKKGDIIERRTKKGRVFYGCSRYPKCKWAEWELNPELRIKN